MSKNIYQKTRINIIRSPLSPQQNNLIFRLAPRQRQFGAIITWGGCGRQFWKKPAPKCNFLLHNNYKYYSNFSSPMPCAQRGSRGKVIHSSCMSNEHKRATNSRRQGQGKMANACASQDMPGCVRMWVCGCGCESNCGCDCGCGWGCGLNPSGDSCCCHSNRQSKSEESFG